MVWLFLAHSLEGGSIMEKGVCEYVLVFGICMPLIISLLDSTPLTPSIKVSFLPFSYLTPHQAHTLCLVLVCLISRVKLPLY